MKVFKQVQNDILVDIINGYPFFVTNCVLSAWEVTKISILVAVYFGLP